MTKLNPIHARMLANGQVKPQDLKLDEKVGNTTAHALSLLADAIRHPNYERSPNSGESWHEDKRIVSRAMEIAVAAKLDLIQQVSSHGDRIIFEYKPQPNDPGKPRRQPIPDDLKIPTID